MLAGCRFVLLFALIAALLVGCGAQTPAPLEQALDDEIGLAASQSLTLTVGGSSSGRSIAHIGANGGGSAQPIMADIRELGLSSYRLFGGMQTFEPVDDDGVYGLPSIADMKRVLGKHPGRVNDFVNWASFDKTMRATGTTLKDLRKLPGMEPLMVLRNSANWGNFWVPRMKITGAACKTPRGQSIVWPQFTQADWNEWWQHVFAVVYWINVRNGNEMRVDRWSVHNEPNQQQSPHSQGWCGSKEQYVEFVKYTSDAIDFVYKTYLNDRPRHVHGGALSMTNWRDWFTPMFRSSGSSFGAQSFFRPTMFNVVDFHPYNDMVGSVRKARQLMREGVTASYVQSYPIWASEMGGFANDQWENPATVIDKLVNPLIGGSTPGESRVDGALVWRMYDATNDRKGLIRRDGSRRPGFYALRLAIMALNGGKPVHPTSHSGGGNVMAITTRESTGRYNLLVSNRSSTLYKAQADLTALVSSGKADLYLFSSARKGASSLTRLSTLNVSSGKLRFDLPPKAVVLVQLRP